VFVADRLLQPSLMFVGRPTNLPCSVAPERCFTRVGYGIRLVWKDVEETNTLVYYEHSYITEF